MRGQADIDRQDPQLLQHFEDAGLRRDRQREQHEVDPRAPGELDDIVHLAELGQAGAGVLRTAVAAVVEHAEDLEVGIVLGAERGDQLLAVAVGADHHGAAVEPALARPASHQRTHHQALRRQPHEPGQEEHRQPHARHLAAELGEERDAHEQQEHEAPGRDHPGQLMQPAAKHLDVVDVGGLEADHRGQRHGDDREHIGPGEAAAAHHVGEIDGKAAQRDQGEVGEPHHAGDHHGRDGGAHLLVGDS